MSERTWVILPAQPAAVSFLATLGKSLHVQTSVPPPMKWDWILLCFRILSFPQRLGGCPSPSAWTHLAQGLGCSSLVSCMSLGTTYSHPNPLSSWAKSPGTSWGRQRHLAKMSSETSDRDRSLPDRCVCIYPPSQGIVWRGHCPGTGQLPLWPGIKGNH